MDSRKYIPCPPVFAQAYASMELYKVIKKKVQGEKLLREAGATAEESIKKLDEFRILRGACSAAYGLEASANEMQMAAEIKKRLLEKYEKNMRYKKAARGRKGKTKHKSG